MDQERDREFDFKPQINDVSRTYIREEKTEDYLLKCGKQAKERIE